MRALVVVEVEVALQRRKQIEAAGEDAGVDEFVLQGPPQTLDENVVQGAASAIHTDRDAALLERRQKIGRGELRSLIGVPDLGLTESKRGLQRSQAEARLHGIGEFPTEHEAAEPIHDGHQALEAATHRKVRNIGAPDVIRPLDRNAAQQVRVDLVARRRPAQIRFRMKGFDTQNPHQPLDALAVDLQRDGHPAAAVERAIQVQFVESPQQAQVLGALRPRLVVIGRARQTEEFALLLDGQARMLGIDL